MESLKAQQEKLERYKKEDLERELLLYPPTPKPKTAQEQWDEIRHDQYYAWENKKIAWVGSPPEPKKKGRNWQQYL